MTFLQPWMLIALPIAALPIVVHLINQRRYRTTQWGAMRFLLAANRANRGYAKIRQWLILALRTLVIAAAVLAVGRPLAGGVLARIGGGSAEAIVLIDRSPSMQTRTGPGGPTMLQGATEQIAATLRTLGTSSVWQVESDRVVATRLDNLQTGLMVGPSDAPADIPAMLLAAAGAIDANQLGQTDVWIASDLRRGDWLPGDGRWASVRQTFGPIAERVRFRLLAAKPSSGGDRSIRVERAELIGTDRGGRAEVELKIVVSGGNGGNQSVPVAVDLGGSRSTMALEIGGESTEAIHRLPVGRDQTAGWGSVSLPADDNGANNVAYFAFDKPPPRKTVVVTDDAEVGRVLSLAAGSPPAAGLETTATVIPPADAAGIVWNDLAMLLWHAALPGDSANDGSAIETFVRRGGQVIFLPIDSQGSDGSFASLQFGDWVVNDPPASVAGWRGDAGLLAASAAGAALPLGELSISRHRKIIGDATPIATLAGGDPLLVRAATDAGGVHFLATTPRAADSSLAAGGIVLYVMIQRAIAAGARELSATGSRATGSVPADEAAAWTRLAGDAERLSTDAAFTAGVYRGRSEAGDGRVWVLNRAAVEDEPAVVSDAELAGLFEGLTIDRIDADGPAGSLIDEIWRAFLLAMLLAMVGEAFLCLPRVTT